MAFPSRYPFTEIKPGVFFFPTDSGLYYTVEIYNATSRFSDNAILANGEKIFEISFDKSSGDKVFDISISETILFIIITNILARGDISIFYFVCDTSGEMGKLRARLFNFWFLKIVTRRSYPGCRKPFHDT